jgi:hypothetical protein
MACLEGIALGLGIKEIACVSSPLQPSYARAYASRFKHAYEDLLNERDFVLNELSLYVSPVPMWERASDECKAHHPTRAKARHALRQKLSASCREFLGDLLTPSTPKSAGESSQEILPHPERPARLPQEEAVLANDTSSPSFG